MGGVEAFFVISAFFLVKKHWGTDTLHVKDQFVHRIKRLYPPYVAVLLVAALFALLKKTIPVDLITHLLSGQNFQWMMTGYSSPMQPMTAHTWTLSIEVWTGLVWLLLLRYLTKKQFNYAMYGMLLLGILYRTVTIILGCNVYVVSLCPIAHFDAFAAGSLLAIGCRNEKLNIRIGALCVPGCVGIVACIYSISINKGISFWKGYQSLSASSNYLNNWFTGNIYLYITLLIAGIVGLLYLWDSLKDDEPTKITRLFVALGDRSYMLYLFHWPILMVVKRWIKPWYYSFPSTLIMAIVATVIFNWVYNTIQKEGNGGMKRDPVV